MIQLNKKVLVISASVLFLVAALATGGWFWLSHNAQSRYTQQIADFKASTATDLKTFDSQFAPLQQEGTNTAVATVLGAAKNRANQLLSSVPREPRVLWINVASQQNKDQANALRQWLFNLQQAVTESEQYIVYKTSITTELSSLPDLKGRDSEEQSLLATAWQEAALRLKTITPPEKVAALHSELTSNVETISVTLAALPDLYNKKDYAGFVAKQKELDSKMAGLQSLHESFSTLNIQHDQAIGLQLRALR